MTAKARSIKQAAKKTAAPEVKKKAQAAKKRAAPKAKEGIQTASKTSLKPASDDSKLKGVSLIPTFLLSVGLEMGRWWLCKLAIFLLAISSAESACCCRKLQSQVSQPWYMWMQFTTSFCYCLFLACVCACSEDCVLRCNCSPSLCFLQLLLWR